ncbi:MAG: PfkB family carbohydrate kinase [Pseudomonadota bacterium]
MADITITGVGGAHFDWVAHMSEAGLPGASTPGFVRSDVGGCCLNTLRVAAQLLPDADVAIVSARGGDEAGVSVEAAIEDAGLRDQSAVFLDRSTPTYTAIMDTAGDVVSAVADMALYETVLPRHLGRTEVRNTISASNVLVVDANLPTHGLEAALSHAPSTVVALAISAAKAERLLPVAANIDLVFMNTRELRALTGGEDPIALNQFGFTRAVITDGDRPVRVLDAEGAITAVNVPHAPSIVDVTGAGDALAGGTIAAMLKSPEKPLSNAVQLGVQAALRVVGTRGPVAPLDWDDLARQAFGHEHTHS